MKTIGITGRSGSGKSSVTSFFAQNGYPVADADKIAREVLLPGSTCLIKLQKRFGTDILDAGGCVQRRLLAERAFATPEGTAALTEVTYPEIERRILTLRDSAQNSGAKLFFVDGAVIVGTPFEKLCDGLLVVDAPEEESVRRICARDGISEASARRRLAAQTAPKDLIRAATFVIYNNSTQEALLCKAKALLEQLLKGGT